MGFGPVHVGEAVDDIVGRDDVELMVREFYRAAAMDDLLGPVFHAAGVDWDVHIRTLVDFWSWQLFGERGYEGNPLRAHEPTHARTPFADAHYDRWIELFVETVDEWFVGPVAELAKGRGIKMAKALRRLLGGEDESADGPVSVVWTTAPPAAASGARLTPSA